MVRTGDYKSDKFEDMLYRWCCLQARAKGNWAVLAEDNDRGENWPGLGL